jgi:hypothetical protein
MAETRFAAGSFLAGIGLGAAVVVIMAAGALTGLERRGVQVEVETARVAAQVRTAVSGAARQELPGAIAGIRQDLPRRVGEETARRLAETRLEVAGLKVPVPPAATQQVQVRMEEAVRLGIDLAVKDADLDAMADRIGQQAYTLVNDRMKQALDGQTYVVKPWPWLSLPVHVVVK